MMMVGRTRDAVAVIPQLVLDCNLDEDVAERAHVEDGVDALAAGDVGSVERAHPALQQIHVACPSYTPPRLDVPRAEWCVCGRSHTGEEADAVVAFVPNHVEVEAAHLELNHVLLLACTWRRRALMVRPVLR
jgi:hypothetical protein